MSKADSADAPEPILLAWSGGKDSTLALEALRADPQVRVMGLLTTVTRGFERVSMHGVRRSLLCLQVAALDLPLYEAPIPPQASNEAYEASLAAALCRVNSEVRALHTVAFGDLFLADVRSYRERHLAALGWGCRFPLWSSDTASLAKHFVTAGYRAVVVCVDTQMLPREFVAREYDLDFLRDLPPGVDPCGENGEFHTFVYAGPLFASGLLVRRGEIVVRDERFVYCDLKTE